MKFSYKATIVAAVLSVGATVSSASTVEVGYQENSVFGTPNLSGAVTITSPFLNGRVAAGPFRLTGSNGFGDFVAFCIDLGHYMSRGQTYTVTDTSNYGSDVDSNIGRLFSSAYSGLTTAVQGAAFQVALWEIITDTGSDSGLDLGDGAFTAGANASVISQAADYLDGLDGAATGRYNMTFLANRNSQDLVTVSPVPVPAAFGMLGLGIAGLFGLRRRKKTT